MATEKQVTLGNLLRNLPNELPEELTEVLASDRNVRIERIVSKGHASAEGFWYEQQESEWVVVLQGCGVLRFEDRSESTTLQPGDWLAIPPGCRHRVESTSQDELTVWLAVFFS